MRWTADYEMDCLFNGVDPRDTSTESTVNLSSTSAVTTDLLSWMNYISSLAADSHIDTQGSTLPTGEKEQGRNEPIVPSTGDQVLTGGTAIDRAADLDYPDVKPPDVSSHLHGRFELSRYGNLEWMTYTTPLLMLQLLKNTVMDDEHWVNGVQPDGTIYCRMDQHGQQVFLRPNEDGHVELVAQIAQ